MKITYLHQYFNTPDMPGGTRSYEMARRLVAMGHEVNMVTSWREADGRTGWFVTDEAGIKVHWLPVPYSNRMGFGERIRAFFQFAFRSAQRAVALDADIVFATSTPLTIALPAVFAARRRKVPMVFEVRDLWPEMPIAMGVLKNPLFKYLARRLERFAYFNSSAVVALSPGMKDGIQKTGFPRSKIVVIPNSCDNNEFLPDSDFTNSFRQSRKWLLDRPLLVYVGTFGRLNNLGYMVELAEELLKIGSEVRILLVGNGQERDSVIDQAKRSGVYETNLFYERAIPKKDVPKLLLSADMSSSLFLDIEEMQSNSANKFFDGLAASKPVFINYGGWMHDVLIKSNCGLSVWRKPMNEVAKLLDEKMKDRAWLESAGLRARRLAEQHFDRDDLSLRLISVLEAVNDGVADDFEKFSTVEYL